MSHASTDSWHSLNASEVMSRLGTRLDGLTTDEVTDRLSRFGRNQIERRKPVSPLRLLFSQFTNPFILVLLFAAALAYGVSFMPGQGGRRLTAYFILGIVLLSVILNFYEEYRAQKEMEALNKLLAFRASVIREGTKQQIDSSEVVPGDILVLSQGQRVPADARIIETHSLRTDESTLTGESVGVDKSPEPVSPDTPLAEQTCMAFASTFVTHGTGLAVAVRTGMSTEVGRIAGTLQQMKERPTPFQIEVRKMAWQMTVIVGILAAIIGVILYFLLHESFVDVALNTLSLAVATIPESLPIVLTFALALGAHQMAVRHAVVQRLAVVESLGSVDTICTDKTGTLTENRMTVQKMFADGSTGEIPVTYDSGSPFGRLLLAGVLCNDAIVEDGPSAKFVGDPVDVALLNAARQAHMDIERERNEYPRVSEIPFSSERKMMTTIHKYDDKFVSYTKGAAEAVLSKCTASWFDGRQIAFGDDQRAAVERVLGQWEDEGLYVLAFSRNEIPSPDAIDAAEQGMTFIGLQAMMDPPRPEVADAIATTKKAGIRVVMITGDNVRTATAVAAKLGLGRRAVEARELENLSRDELRQRMEGVDIVARATPDIKQHVLQALQDAGHFVAMTGDGVNDATALKQSDVGVSMGLRGTDIAKESSSMVLLDDNFATIVAAIEEGRRIFDNIRKFTNYLLSTSLGEVVAVLALSITGYFPLSAQMLLWINVVTDLMPASALAADPSVPQIMTRRPRRHNEAILNRAINATIVGSVLRTLIAYVLIFWAGLLLGGIVFARTMLFTGIVLHAFTRIMVVRQLDNLSLWSNRALLWSYGGAVALQLVALYTPLRIIFGVVPLGWQAWVIMVPVVALSSLAGVYMTRWILRLIPLWEQ
ncbi:MAG: cation-transporting P-type ATPase [Armatimonadota bacterium]|nr:cation-transporting P-type ATPase [Armatimonadota bacterium]